MKKRVLCIILAALMLSGLQLPARASNPATIEFHNFDEIIELTFSEVIGTVKESQAADEPGIRVCDKSAYGEIRL